MAVLMGALRAGGRAPRPSRTTCSGSRPGPLLSGILCRVQRRAAGAGNRMRPCGRERSRQAPPGQVGKVWLPASRQAPSAIPASIVVVGGAETIQVQRRLAGLIADAAQD